MYRFLITSFLLFFTVLIVTGQISQGGSPIQIPGLKSLEISEEIMPYVNNKELEVRVAGDPTEENQLKSLQFAWGFEVNISPAKNGIWTTNVNGFDVWQVKIRSAGAYSLGLIFDNFDLPEGSRLFVYSEKHGHILGAFTSFNNKTSGKFAVSPVAGDEIVVHYEILSGRDGRNDFVISHVNHDFIGILKYSDRRPMGKTAGSCNVDINCLEGEKWSDEKDAVCRIITTKSKPSGTISEICTGTLVNNTRENEKPYIITAAHCIEDARFAETTVFAFNYESPYCAPLDGDPGNSISGSRLLAISDSLDFALVELSVIPPPEFRPYYAGWERRQLIPDSTFSIHHPQGDIKKIAIDRNQPIHSNFISGYTPNGFLRIARWETGVTEDGSSGGALFNPDKKLVGTLTGGSATCFNPVNDYFSRFELAWEYKPDSSKQLKYWLDPLNLNPGSLSGRRFYADENFCISYTNLGRFDEHENVVLRKNGQFSGYWGGTNNVGISEFAERFILTGEERIHGVSLGIGKRLIGSNNNDKELKINVYNGNDAPESLIHSEMVKMNTLVANAMNFIEFTNYVEPAGTFFVGFEMINMQPQDSFVVFQSLRDAGKENFFWFKQNNSWYDFKSENSENYSMANVFELIVCNATEFPTDTPLVKKPLAGLIYPNPAAGSFVFEAGQEIDPEKVSVFNLIGQEIRATKTLVAVKKVQIDLSGNIPGIYFVQFKTMWGTVSKKVTYIPW